MSVFVCVYVTKCVLVYGFCVSQTWDRNTVPSMRCFIYVCVCNCRVGGGGGGGRGLVCVGHGSLLEIKLPYWALGPPGEPRRHMLHFPRQALPAWVLSGCTLPPAGKVAPNITLNIYLTIYTFPLQRPPHSQFVVNVFTHLFIYLFIILVSLQYILHDLYCFFPVHIPYI